MSTLPNRLPPDAAHGFGGSEIDRSRSITLRLNGRTIRGYAGDTVLSAALAAGIQIAGRHGEEAIALDESFAPLVALPGGAPLPMDRTPAVDGAHFTTVGTRRDVFASRGIIGALRHRIVGPARTLNHRFGEAPSPTDPWVFDAPAETLAVDVAVVGGGIAGLSAAAAAAAAGQTVALVERDQCLGGAVAYFGMVDGDAPPDEAIADFVGKLGERVTVLTRAEAFSVTGNRIGVHRVALEGGRPKARVISIEAAHIILATGARERLPIFPGNRTPGIVGSLAAWQRARRYGVWAGRRALITTPHSFAYRLALQATDAGIDVQRIVDSRLTPTSRFIDFAKATGVTLASALAPSHAQPLEHNKPGLRVGFAVNIDEIEQDSTAIETDQLIAAGGWQPDIVLWIRAGGSAVWDRDASWLSGTGTVPGVSLVGSAAGWRSTAAAIASGAAAVLSFLGKRAPEVIDRSIDAAFETPDAATPIAPFRPQALGNTYLDRGSTLITRRTTVASRHGVSGIATRPVQLGLGDIAAAVDIGMLAPRDAGPVAAERSGIAGDITDTGWRPEAVTPGPVLPAPPAWLAGRFGDKPQVWAIASADARNFTPGGLIFENSDTTDPLKAIGVTYAPPRRGSHGAIAVLAFQPEVSQLFVRDAGVAVAARLTDRLKPE